MFGIATPTEASVISVIYALFLGVFIYKTLNFSIIRKTFIESIKLAGLSLFCLGSAGLFGWIISYYRIPYLIAELVKNISSPLLLLTIITLICLILGMFLDGLVVATIIGPLFMPAVLSVGINPIHYGIVASTAIATGLITPPYGLCLLIGASIGEIPVHKTLLDIGKMLFGLLIVLGILIFIPRLSTWIPDLISQNMS